MQPTWILVADNWHARLFNMPNRHTLEEMEGLAHPGTHQHNRDLTSDKPGRAQESAAPTRHAISPRTEPLDVETEKFVGHIAEHLQQQSSRFHKLHILASPKMLGKIRQHLSADIQAKVVHESPKDLLKSTPEDILKHITASL